jgi:ATP-dependent Clp protease ATP-binding subunit ClpA
VFEHGSTTFIGVEDVAWAVVFERFDHQARQAVEVAFEEARSFGHEQVGTEHLLLGLLRVGRSDAARALIGCGATLEGCRAKVAEAAASKQHGTARSELTLTDRAARALERATRLSLRQRRTFVETDHVLLSVLDVEGTAGQVLRGLSVDLGCIRQTINSAAKPESGIDSSGSTSQPAAGVIPRCANCESTLDITLAHKAVSSGSEDGTSVRCLIVYCSSCGTALSGHQISD